MATQEIKNLKVKDLHLWTENPRDPVDTKSTDFDIIKRAIDEESGKWNLDKLIKEMGDHYDFSEIPTVVIIDKVPVVYDGNRRAAVLKYLQNPGLYSQLSGKLYLNEGPEELRELLEIPCNICDKETALTNIERKHSTNGSWGILEREYFLSQHRDQKPSLFQEIEETTRIISQHPKMNQRFVKDEVLTEKNLKDIGFAKTEEGLVSIYSGDEARAILDEIVLAVNSNAITTRNSRGKLKDALVNHKPELNNILREFDSTQKANKLKAFDENKGIGLKKTPISRQTDQIFGRTLSLQAGPVNDLYRAIDSIYSIYKNDSKQLNVVLPIIGMSLRLVLDVAARKYYEDHGDTKANRDQLYKEFLKLAKQTMNQQSKNFTSLTNGWLSDKDNMDGILGKYAHGNISTHKNDVLSTSVIVGDILEEYFNKQNDSNKKP